MNASAPGLWRIIRAKPALSGLHSRQDTTLGCMATTPEGRQEAVSSSSMLRYQAIVACLVEYRSEPP
ncbi:hypothetical protein [Jiella avicenniae]|uniref:hypothetical protein n=1 Tax=Jiella avicenniae TaxID=2907202 RepID=UPI001F2DA06F|nr:hypothetical protein [Jiella avicenniae]